MGKSKIEWTEETWNPATGCTKVSPGCKNCYAEGVAKKLKEVFKNWKYRFGFKYTEHENEIDKPLHWNKPRKIFVNSMSDMFHPDASASFLEAVFETMLIADQHIYQILTKRPKIMEAFIKNWLQKKGFEKVPKHIWLGTSVENQDYVTRIDTLRNIPAHIHFISFEPLLGPILGVNFENIQWVIVGGESGSNHREIREEWIESLRIQCESDGVKFFFKQWGGIRFDSGGRLLNGKTYDEYPEIGNVRGLQEQLS